MGPASSSRAVRPHSSFLGVVFAGGRATRMGRDKALLSWTSSDGRELPLFAHGAETLMRLCDFVEISVGPASEQGPEPEKGTAGRREAVASWPWGMIVDPESIGPLGGLLASLRRAQELDLKGVLVLACDMPLVEAEDFDPLLKRLDLGSDVALWAVEDAQGVVRDQPLCAAYALSALPAVEAAVAAGARRVVAIEREAAATGRLLRMDRLPARENSNSRLVNVNTPSDYDSVRRARGLPPTHGRSPSSGPTSAPSSES